MARSADSDDTRSQLDLFEAATARHHPASRADAADAGAGAGRGAGPGAAAATMAFRHPRAGHEVSLDGHLVAYEFRRGRRRSIGFVVGSDGLSVAAPRWVGMAEVESALREKARWILRKLAEQAERGRRHEAARVQWGDGAEIPYLGRPLRLRVDPGVSGAVLDPAADSSGPPRLRIGLPANVAPGALRERVQGWLQHQALHLFEERCALFAARLGVQVRRIRLSDARSRWGSASADGSIRLNWRLVHLPMSAIDYVVAHELAHLRHMDHSPQFWDVVRSVIPDVDVRRSRLREEVLPVLD